VHFSSKLVRANTLANLAPFRAFSRLLLGALALISIPATAQNSPSLPAQELVRRAVANEMKSDQTGKHMFREHKETLQGSQSKLMVETRDAMVGMLIARNGHPLSLEEQRGEYDRIQHFIDDPAELDRKRRKEKEDSDRVKSILKGLPDAFLYQYDGTETGKPGVGKPGEELIRLKFRPNPKYQPPTHVEEVLTGMEGVVLIDAREQHIARIDGTLFQEVGFGWGILGHLDRGGHFQVDQTDVGNNDWTISRMDLAFTGKVLLFKSLNIKSTEVYSDFRPVPSSLTFAQGAEMLKKEIATVAENKLGGGK
jgi:hypothetical protein